MPEIWHGTALNVLWPHSEKHQIDLDIELWYEHQNEWCRSIISEFQTLKYDGFVSLDTLPLWSIISSEMTVMSVSKESREFFGIFSTIQFGIALNLYFSEKKSWHLIVYAVKDEVEGITKILARIIDVSITLELPIIKPPETQIELNSDSVDFKTQSENKANGNSLTDVKTSISQTVMAALRLRGIKRSSQDFKKIYYAMHSLVDISLRKMKHSEITAEIVHEKVEQIWNVIES